MIAKTDPVPTLPDPTPDIDVGVQSDSTTPLGALTDRFVGTSTRGSLRRHLPCESHAD